MSEPRYTNNSDPFLEVSRRKRDHRKGKTRKQRPHFTKSDYDRDFASLQSFNGLTPEQVGISSLDIGGRWLVLNYRTSSKPFVAKVPYLRTPRVKHLQTPTTYHWLWNNAGKTDKFPCLCGESHTAETASRRHRNLPKFFKEKGFSQILPEFAVVSESVICDIFGVSFPSEQPEELSSESKRFLQHIIRRYEIRKANFERTKESQTARRELLLSSSSGVLAPPIDFSSLRSVEIPVPTEQMWVIVFQESWEIDHGISRSCAYSMVEKLSNFDIPSVTVEISPSAYGEYAGYRGLNIFGRWADGARSSDQRRSKATRQRGKVEESDFELHS